MPNNPNRRLKLTTKTQTFYDGNLTQSYRLSVTASDGNLMPNEVFLFHRLDPVPGYPVGADNFKGVCNPAQLVGLPVNEPAANSLNNYYRKAQVELTFYTESEATDAWEGILSAVKTLKTALDYQDGLTTVTYWIGNPQ